MEKGFHFVNEDLRVSWLFCQSIFFRVDGSILAILPDYLIEIMDFSWLLCRISTYQKLWIYFGYFARFLIKSYGFILATMPDYLIGLMD